MIQHEPIHDVHVDDDLIISNRYAVESTVAELMMKVNRWKVQAIRSGNDVIVERLADWGRCYTARPMRPDDV